MKQCFPIATMHLAFLYMHGSLAHWAVLEAAIKFHNLLRQLIKQCILVVHNMKHDNNMQQ